MERAPARRAGGCEDAGASPGRIETERDGRWIRAPRRFGRGQPVTPTLAGSDLNLLVALRAVLEHRNLTRAGNQLGVGQPAMSVALTRLRQHYGDELLMRVGRDYELTPFARTLLPEVQRAVSLIERGLRLQNAVVAADPTQIVDIALSDYAAAILLPLLRRSLAEQDAPVLMRVHSIPPDMHVREFGMLDFDLMVAPLGFGFVAESVELFRDRFVCITDPHNSALVDGALSLDAFASLGHARTTKGLGHLTERHLAELGIKTTVRVAAPGWLPLAFVVSGTDLVATMPERLARLAQRMSGVAIIEPPFGDLPLIEALWWHSSRASDPMNAQFRRLVCDAAADLAPVRALPASAALAGSC